MWVKFGTDSVHVFPLMNHDSRETRCSVSYALLAGDSVCMCVCVCVWCVVCSTVPITVPTVATFCAADPHTAPLCNCAHYGRTLVVTVMTSQLRVRETVKAKKCHAEVHVARYGAHVTICCFTDTICLFGLCP